MNDDNQIPGSNPAFPNSEYQPHEYPPSAPRPPVRPISGSREDRTNFGGTGPAGHKEFNLRPGLRSSQPSFNDSRIQDGTHPIP